jgi:hypothetical protein
LNSSLSIAANKSDNEQRPATELITDRMLLQVLVMTQREFQDLLTRLGALSPEQLAALRRELDHKTAVPAGETVFDVMDRAGLIGCLKGTPNSPTDLSTNPKHMEGFGRG